ncbi:MAG: hypothetical protein QOH57_865 [Mycobacterium sp.]|jgi:hypothetical protein|nr:hypothetical protein [Mycobacterium sp.]
MQGKQLTNETGHIMKFVHIASAAAGLAAAALVAAPIASASPAQEQDFLQILVTNGLKWPAGKDQAIIDTGNGVCTDWKNGATLDGEVADLQKAVKSAGLGWTDYQIGVLIGAATAEFCPQFKSKIQ